MGLRGWCCVVMSGTIPIRDWHDLRLVDFANRWGRKMGTLYSIHVLVSE